MPVTMGLSVRFGIPLQLFDILAIAIGLAATSSLTSSSQALRYREVAMTPTRTKESHHLTVPGYSFLKGLLWYGPHNSRDVPRPKRCSVCQSALDLAKPL